MTIRISNLFFTCICYLIFLIVFGSIWIPLIHHYYVKDVVITDKMVSTARSAPSNSVLDEIREFFGRYDSSSKDRAISKAEEFLRGEISIPGHSGKKLTMPFNVHDLNKGPSQWQLHLASLDIPNGLLNSYELIGQDDLLMAARDIILSWALYERKAWLPKGFLWNDHAIAARISVLAKFWKLYRKHPNYDADVAKAILLLVARSGQQLAKNTHFTFSSNHGFMQNLALWQICLAFPSLPNVEYYRQLAFERMRDQMTFLINDEGVILEHSPGYQRAGLEFISMAFRYLFLLGLDIPREWKSKYQLAKDFYAHLRRPDGTLPLIGDTGGFEDSFGPLVVTVDSRGEIGKLHYMYKWIPKESFSLYPVAGYSIWWDGLAKWRNESSMSQTAITWSNFSGHAHKHADEMSVLLWANGQTWWTNVGYWHYGSKGRMKAVSWAGSNAPHLVAEGTKSARQTKLKMYGCSEHLSFIDMEREGPMGYMAHRQVVQVKPNLWIIVDHTLGNENEETTTTWTTSHDVKLKKGDIPGSYILETQNNSATLKKFLFSSGPMKIMQFRGSFSPFAGWHKNKPSSAILIEQPANDSWTVAIWSLQNDFGANLQVTSRPYMKKWRGPEDWEIVIPVASGLTIISRKNDQLHFKNDELHSIPTSELILTRSPDIKHNLNNIHTAFESVAKKYPQPTYSVPRRLKTTYFLLILFICQETFFIIYRKLFKKYYTYLRVLTIFPWTGVILWLHVSYF